MVTIALSSLPAMTEEVQFSLFAHDTDDVLSHLIPMCTNFICSKINQAMSSLASSRSFIVIVPCGFDSEMTLFLISAGHLHLHTTGCSNCFVPSVQASSSYFKKVIRDEKIFLLLIIWHWVHIPFVNFY